jgi:hypothetical protein
MLCFIGAIAIVCFVLRISDLRVGGVIPIYRWQFHLVEADHKTQDFIRSEDSHFEELE